MLMNIAAYNAAIILHQLSHMVRLCTRCTAHIKNLFSFLRIHDTCNQLTRFILYGKQSLRIPWCCGQRCIIQQSILTQISLLKGGILLHQLISCYFPCIYAGSVWLCFHIRFTNLLCVIPAVLCLPHLYKPGWMRGPDCQSFLLFACNFPLSSALYSVQYSIDKLCDVSMNLLLRDFYSIIDNRIGGQLVHVKQLIHTHIQ